MDVGAFEIRRATRLLTIRRCFNPLLRRLAALMSFCCCLCFLFSHTVCDSVIRGKYTWSASCCAFCSV